MIGGPSALFAVLARLPGRADGVPDEVLAAPGLANAAARHGVAGWVLDGLEGRTLPDSLRHELTASARSAFAHAAQIKRLTIKALDALAAHDITPIALKGSVLASRLYPTNPLVRPSTDVDVLVTPAELDRARTALTSLGLSHVVDTASADPLDDHHHDAFAGPPGLVELHFRLTNTFGGGLFDDASVRSRAVRTSFEGRSVLVLSPEDEFLYLSTHAANHAFMRASWLVDLQQYLRLVPNLDFHLMAARAADAGFLNAATVAFDVLARLLDVSLPPAAHDAFSIRRARRLVDRLVFSPAQLEAATLSTHSLASFGLRLWMVDSPRRAARHVTDGAWRFARRALARR